jgi:hypothetical protein
MSDKEVPPVIQEIEEEEYGNDTFKGLEELAHDSHQMN